MLRKQNIIYIYIILCIVCIEIHLYVTLFKQPYSEKTAGIC
jgi:hypothetical protein